MLTYPDAPVIRDERAPYRPFTAAVRAVERITPHFIRVTFTGDDFEWFATHGLDQRIKIIFPIEGAGLSDLADAGDDWHARLRELPTDKRNPFRTYTIRAVRPAVREVDVDFAWHGVSGPAAQWVSTAVAGDEVIIVGPDARSIHSAIGMDWHPGTARTVLLAGDETAAPAICSIVESLGQDVSVTAFIEVHSSADAIPTAAGSSIEWISRADGESLESAVRAWAAANPGAYRSAVAADRQPLEDIDVDRELLWDSPEESAGDFYAWIAGESAAIKSLRRFLVSETGIDRKRVAFMGYWRLGKAEAQA